MTTIDELGSQGEPKAARDASEEDAARHKYELRRTKDEGEAEPRVQCVLRRSLGASQLARGVAATAGSQVHK